MPYHLRLLVNQRLTYSTDVDFCLELGRQRANESEEPRLQTIEGGQRLVVAPLAENSIGRRQLIVKPVSETEVEINNVSEVLHLKVTGHPLLPPGAVHVFSLPLTIVLNTDRLISLDTIDISKPLHGLGEMTEAPRQSGDLLSAIQRVSTIRRTPELDEAMEMAGADFGRQKTREIEQSEFLVIALQKVMDVFQTASTAEKLFTSAVEGAVSLLEFDTARVLSCCEGRWSEELTYPDGKHRSISTASNLVLRRLLQEHRTFWNTDESQINPSASLKDVEAVIAAPILDPLGNVIGALYGDRRRRFTDSRSSLTNLEARLMELLACGISSGLARQQQEAVARKMRLQFEQFFTPKLAAELEQHPDLLSGRDAEVSILFCDIRGFSRITERIGTTKTFDWIGDVMGDLSSCVLQHQGVLVDYIGDELMAMWGAPQPQSNHRELACNAAQEMLKRLPEINARWFSQLGEAMDLGIGINSGMVKVGNSGSQFKFKYSPLGNAVNLASRVQGATKHLGVQLLVTGDTAASLPPTMLSRALCDVQVVNLDTPVRLFELLPEGTSPILMDGYARALQAFENREFRSAAHFTGKLIDDFPDDGPSLVLLSRIVDALIAGPKPEHPVWKLAGK